ncbi:MAG TPA: hypothetical protein VFG89_02930 [Coriobacteriia bacterium]|nr:hypothetical protein [Coriobacteriia bacterium]
MRIGRVLLILLVVAIIGAVGYVVLNPDIMQSFRPTKAITNQKQIDSMTLGFVREPYSDDYNNLRVPGWVDNRSKQDMKSISVEIQLMDEKQQKKEKITYDIQNVKAGTRQTFDINAGTIPPGRTATIKIKKLEVIQ